MCMWCWLFIVMKEHVTQCKSVTQHVLIVLWWWERQRFEKQHSTESVRSRLWFIRGICWQYEIYKIFLDSSFSGSTVFSSLHLQLAVDLHDCQCQEMNGSVAELCLFSSIRFAFTLYWQLSEKKKVCCVLVFQQDVCFTLDSFCRRRESDVPLTKTVVLPPTMEGDDPVTFTPDVLTHRPHHGVTGSGAQKCHTVLQLHPATEKKQTLN